MKFTNDQINYIKDIAKKLIDDGENIEYTRGICELIADIDGKKDMFHEDRSEEIKNELLNIDEFDFDMDEPCKNYSVYLIPTSQPIHNDPDFGFDTVKQLAEQRFEFDEYEEANNEALNHAMNSNYYVFVVNEFEGMLL